MYKKSFNGLLNSQMRKLPHGYSKAVRAYGYYYFSAWSHYTTFSSSLVSSQCELHL